MSRTPDVDLQALLAEEPFVRTLAQALAAGDADDVVQQTWLLALQHGGGLDRPRSWLVRIAHNVARTCGAANAGGNSANGRPPHANACRRRPS